MPANFIKIETVEKLDELFEESHHRPVIVFKHSNSCGTSADIFGQIANVNGDINYIVVQENRPISNAIEEKTGFRHHSPQAFVIKDGKPIYHATHYGINVEQLSVASCRLPVEEDLQPDTNY